MKKFLCWFFGHPENKHSGDLPEGSTRLCPRCRRMIVKVFHEGFEPGCGRYVWDVIKN